jgi:hypothetical protein
MQARYLLRAVTTAVLLTSVAVAVTATPAAAQPAVSAPVRKDDLDRRQSTIQRTEPAEAFFAINGIARAILQGVANGERAADRAQGSVFGTGSLEVSAVLRPAEWARVFLDVQGLVGPGPEQALGTLSRVNFDADQLEGRNSGFLIKELWLRLALLDGRLRFNVGKLDVGHYFDRNFLAEDDTTQFIDAALLNNPMLKPPPNGPAAAGRLSVGDWRYAFGVQAPDDVDGDLSGLPYVIGELGRRNIFPLRGHYRWWARVSAVPEDRDRVTWGSGISIDQLVTPEVGVFVRAGLSRSEGEGLTSHAWSGGLQVIPRWLERGMDRFGVGYSFQREPAGREKLVETYYTLGFAEWLSMTANVQWVIVGPNQVRGGTNRNVVVPGLRAVLVF